MERKLTVTAENLGVVDDPNDSQMEPHLWESHDDHTPTSRQKCLHIFPQLPKGFQSPARVSEEDALWLALWGAQAPGRLNSCILWPSIFQRWTWGNWIRGPGGIKGEYGGRVFCPVVILSG